MFLNQYNTMQNTAKFYWNYSALSEVTDVQRSNTSSICLQVSHLLSIHPLFLV